MKRWCFKVGKWLTAIRISITKVMIKWFLDKSVRTLVSWGHFWLKDTGHWRWWNKMYFLQRSDQPLCAFSLHDTIPACIKMSLLFKTEIVRASKYCILMLYTVSNCYSASLAIALNAVIRKKSWNVSCTQFLKFHNFTFHHKSHM